VNLHSVLSLLKDIQLCAISCIGNILLTFNITSIGNINEVWTFLCTLCAEAINCSAFDTIIGTTNAMWTILRNSPSLGQIITPQQVESIVFLINNSPIDEIRTNCVGILGPVAIQPQFATQAVIFGKLFIERLSDSSHSVLAEALNCIFDVFADNFQEVFDSLQMLSILQSFKPHFINRLRTEKKLMDRNILERLDEAKINLNRFLKYKSKML